MANQPDPWKFFRNDVKSPMALILEYFPDMKHLSFYNLTVDIANVALSILTRIHEAHILHRNFFPRNILVSPSGRVVVVCIVPYFTWTGLVHTRSQVDFGDVLIHPDDTVAYVGKIGQFLGLLSSDTTSCHSWVKPFHREL
jgi:serine/threonine protein kinase